MQEADEKVTTAMSSFQDIATMQIATVTKEVETERSRLYDELQEHQTTTILESEVEHKKHIQALDDTHAEFSHEVDKITAETEARV